MTRIFQSLCLKLLLSIYNAKTYYIIWNASTSYTKLLKMLQPQYVPHIFSHFCLFVCWQAAG